jgi:hypothetical protein
VNRQTAACNVPSVDAIGDTVTPKYRALIPASVIVRRTIGEPTSSASAIRSVSAGGGFQRVTKRLAGHLRVDLEDALRGWIDRLHRAGAIDHDQARRQALDDLIGEPLRRFGARRHRALLHLQLDERVLQRHRQHDALAARFAPRVAPAHHADGADNHDHEQDGDDEEDGEHRHAREAQCFRRHLQEPRVPRDERLADETWRSTAPIARKVPNGNAYFIAPLCTAIKPRPMNAPANDDSTR